MIDLDDFLFRLWFVFAGIVVFILLVLLFYAMVSEISKGINNNNNNTNDYQNCVCEKVEVK